MPAEYIIDSARGIVFSRGTGVVTDDDLRGHAANLKADPQFKPTFRQFVDYSQVSDLKVTAAGVSSISGAANPFDPSAVRAAFAPQDVVFGMARMFGSMHNALNMLVTHDRAAAEQHVGLAAGESETVFER